MYPCSYVCLIMIKANIFCIYFLTGANIRPFCILLSVDKLFQGLNIQKKKLKHGKYHNVSIFLTIAMSLSTFRYTRISDNTSLNLEIDLLPVWTKLMYIF